MEHPFSIGGSFGGGLPKLGDFAGHSTFMKQMQGTKEETGKPAGKTTATSFGGQSMFGDINLFKPLAQVPLQGAATDKDNQTSSSIFSANTFDDKRGHQNTPTTDQKPAFPAPLGSVSPILSMAIGGSSTDISKKEEINSTSQAKDALDPKKTRY